MAGLSLEFKVRVLPGHVQLDCTGSFVHEEALAIFTRAFALAAEHGRDAVLIDARGVKPPPEPSLMERYDSAVHVAGMHLRQIPRIRLAVLGDEPIIHPHRFGEIVATNRGANARVFTDEQMALDWLLAKPKTP